MRRLYDFKCAAGHVHEHLVDDGVREVECSTCGGAAKRTITTVNFHLDGTSGHFPTATDKWIREHERHASSRQVDKG
jgi:predicted nucleic acid-binding Zn ribbon protein